jgi:hypothetical protein
VLPVVTGVTTKFHKSPVSPALLFTYVRVLLVTVVTSGDMHEKTAFILSPLGTAHLVTPLRYW